MTKRRCNISIVGDIVGLPGINVGMREGISEGRAVGLIVAKQLN